jgi:hypothetical protein
MEEFGRDASPPATPRDESVDPNIHSCLGHYRSLLDGQSDGLPLVLQRVQDANPGKKRIASRLDGFNPKDTPAWREITRRFGASIKQPELVSIASVLAQSTNIKLDRDAKRRKAVLIKWFEENWTTIEPFLDYVVLEHTTRAA